MIHLKSTRLFSAVKAITTMFLLLISIYIGAQIKVACIGNSITAGSGLKKEQSYPSQMQTILGNKYEVRNFGVSGRTLLSKGDHPYILEKKYNSALEWKPEIVIIKLGTNDSKQQNWIYKSEYIPDYITLINSFKLLSSKPKVYICLPLPAFQHRFGINDSVISNDIIPMIKEVSRKTKCKLIDLNTPFKGKSDFTHDGIHPNAEGAKLIANIITKKIQKRFLFF